MRFAFRFVLSLLLAAFSFEACAGIHGYAGVIPPATFLSTQKLGAGGWVRGMDVNADGTRVARTDTHGCYIWNATSSAWVSIESQTTLPNANFALYPKTGTPQIWQSFAGGCYEAGSAPSNSSVIYQIFNGTLFVSTNQGSTFSVVGLPATFTANTSGSSTTVTVTNLIGTLGLPVSGFVSGSFLQGAGISSNPTTIVSQTSGTPNGNGVYVMSSAANLSNATITAYYSQQPNGNFSADGRKFAIDPISPDTLILGTDANGMFKVTGGTGGSPTFTPVTGVPISTNGAGYNIAYDLNPATQSGGFSQHVLAFGGGLSGAYESWNGGSTWTATTGGPTTMQHMVFGSNGVAWATDGANDGTSGALWQYVSGSSGTLGTWTNQTGAGTSWHTVAVDPANVNRILVGGPGGTINIGTVSGTSISWAGSKTPVRAVCNDIGWLCNTNESFMTSGDMIFDPSVSNTIIFGEGIGVWTFNPPSSGSTYSATSNSAGIEQLVTNDVVSSCGNGIPVYAYWDRGVSKLTDVTAYPANQGMQNGYGYSILGGWEIEYVSTNPLHLVSQAISNLSSPDFSGYSEDCGSSWLPFNSWNATVAASNTTVLNSSTTCQGVSNCVEFVVPSTSGLTTWSAGSGTIVLVRPIFTPVNSAPAGLPSGYYYATIIDSTHIAVPITFTSAMQTSGISYILAVNSNPLSTWNGNLTVANVVSGTGGIVRVSSVDPHGDYAGQTGAPICVSGVTMSGSTVVNGCWIQNSNTQNQFDLRGSSFSGGDTYVSGGVMTVQIFPGGGYIAAASDNNIIKVPNGDMPYCTTDGGQTWTIPTFSGSFTPPVNAPISTATWASTSGGQVTFTTTSNSNIAVGQTFWTAGVSVAGYNKITNGAAYTALSGTSGTTIVATLTSNPGSSGAGGVIIPTSLGWLNNYYYFAHAAAADRVAANTIYLFNSLGNGSIWKVVNCATVTLQNSNPGFIDFGASDKLRSVPGNSGHLLFASGNVGSAGSGHPVSTKLWWSNNGGVNWYQVTSTGQVIAEPQDASAGAIKPGNDYPTVHFVGWLNGVYGIYRSTSSASDWAGCASSACTVTWTKVADYIGGDGSGASCINTDLTTWNRFYECKGGAGAAFGQQNFLLKRDIDPSSNDNDPMWLEKAA